MEGPKAPSEARRRQAGCGLRRGAVALPSMGVQEHCSQKILKFNSASLFIFFHDFKTDSSSIRCFSFIYCLYLFYLRQKSPLRIRGVSRNALINVRYLLTYLLHFATSHLHTPAKSTAHLTKSTAHFVSENTNFRPWNTLAHVRIFRKIEYAYHTFGTLI